MVGSTLNLHVCCTAACDDTLPGRRCWSASMNSRSEPACQGKPAGALMRMTMWPWAINQYTEPTPVKGCAVGLKNHRGTLMSKGWSFETTGSSALQGLLTSYVCTHEEQHAHTEGRYTRATETYPLKLAVALVLGALR